MIATLSGKLKLRDPGRLIIDTAGVGYEVFVLLTASVRMDAASSNGHARAGSLLDDAVSALINLGYKPAEAKRAVDAVDTFDEQDGLESLIRKSLAIILGEK